VSIFLARPERPADGIRLAVKDLLDTAGLVTTYGSIVFAEHVPERTAEAVARLEAAGYAIVGKTNLHEFAYGISSQNPHFGTFTGDGSSTHDRRVTCQAAPAPGALSRCPSTVRVSRAAAVLCNANESSLALL
jgi:hypothetical protein